MCLKDFCDEAIKKYPPKINPKTGEVEATYCNFAVDDIARRMGYIEPRGEYADIAELALYNGMLAGISLDGVSYFYENPLEAHPKLFRQNQTYTKARDHMPDIRRKRVFDCSCCPPNLLRVIASMGDFAMSHTKGRLYVHQYFSSTADTPFGKIEEEWAAWVKTLKP